MAVFPLDVRAELNLGGTWTDVTGDVRLDDPITIKAGRRDETSAVSPSSCTLKLNNKNGQYSDKNPLSPYFGLLGRNTPLRVSVQGDERYLALDGDPTGRAQTPDTPSLGITGDLDVRFEITTDWYAPGVHTIIGKYDDLDPAGQRSWLVRLDDGQLRFYWSPDGTGDALLVASWTLFPGHEGREAFRCTLQVDDGAGGLNASLYHADSLDGPWALYGTPVTAAFTTSVFASTAPLQIAPYFTTFNGTRTPFVGRGHRFELRNGIDGPVVAGVDFSTVAADATSFTDTAGLPWTVDGTAEVTDREPRFVGEVSAWPQRWDVSGNDVWTPLTAAGVLRRYGQGTKPLQSTLRRRIPSADPAPIAYWPMEEGQSATQAYSPLPGVEPLRTTGMQWGQATGLPSSAPLPALGQSASLRASVAGTDRNGWQISMVYRCDEMPQTLTRMWRVHLTGATNAAYVQALIGAGSVRMETRDADGQLLVGYTDSDPTRISLLTSAWNRLQLYSGVDDSGAAYWGIAYYNVDKRQGHGVFIYDYDGTVPGAISSLEGSWGSGFAGMALGHVAIFDIAGRADRNPSVQVYEGADDGFAGETTIGRMRRLSTEEQLPLRIIGDPAQTELVGPQRVETILALLQSAADVDGGLLHEDRDRPILAYRARHTLYNQAPALVLDYTARGEVMPPLEPTEDDQNTRNDITVTRDGGSSARAVQETGPLNVADPPAGVGRYDTEVTVNAYTDSQLLDLAGWRLHLGTWDGSRYPSVQLAVHAAPHLAPAVRTLRLLDRVQITNPPPWLPPGIIDLLVEGYTETLGLYRWDMTLTCSPAGPWSVGVVGDDVLGRADTDGTILAAPVAPGTTTLPVRAETGPDWTTNPDEFPFDLLVGGEIVTATACTEAEATPLRADTATSTIATDTAAVAPTLDATAAGDLLVCAWVPWESPEDWTIPTGMTRQADTTGHWSTLTDATETTAAAGPTGTRTATRSTDSTWAAVSVLAAGVPVIEEHLEGVATDPALGHAPGPVSLTTGAETQSGWWLLAVHALDNAGSTDSAAPQGAGWAPLAATPQGDTSTPFIGAWARPATGGAETVTFPAGDADDNHARLYVLSGVTDLTAQLMTVTRAVNGVVKPQTAGTDVRLAHPAIVAL